MKTDHASAPSMYLRELELAEFRSYRRLDVSFSPAGLRLSGGNGSGKSTLLEAIAMLATTRSPRSVSERDVINWMSGDHLAVPPFARLRGVVERDDAQVEIEIGLQLEPQRPGIVRKQIRLGGRPVRAMDAVGQLKAVLFSPEDVALLAGAPTGRRRYLDLTISQLDGAYLRALSRYGRVLTQRNSLLKGFARTHVSASAPTVAAQLAFWDDELVALGAAVVARRFRTIRRLAELTRQRYGWLTGHEGLDVSYRSSVPLDALLGPAESTLDASQAVVARELGERIAAARFDEVRRGVTLIGPHRDDLGFVLDGVDLGIYGSRGQQRLAVVALKLAETALMIEVAGDSPVLLLDDVLSELDVDHQALVMKTAAAVGAQVIVTATERSLLQRADLASLPEARVESGGISLVDSPII